MMHPESLQPLIALAGELRPGTVCLVGAGPGDSTLVTVRGALRLTQADVVLHDKLVGAELLRLIPPQADRIFVGKWRGEHPWTQEQINAELISQARRGRRVVRLKGGDPFVFGRGGEECEALAAAGVPFEVVPGITAAFGAPTYAGIPLTHRGLSRSFALVTGHCDPDAEFSLDFAALARMETLAIYMGVKHLAANAKHLIDAGLDASTPAAVIEWGTRPTQRTIVGTIGGIAEQVAAARIQTPALVLIGKVVAVRENIEWFEHQPLHGQVVVVTRMCDQAAALSAPLQAAGAEVIEAPTIELALVENTDPLDAAIRNMSSYQWLVLTSTNGVDALFARLDALGLDVRSLAGPKVAAIGSATARRLTERGVRADLIPTEAVGEALADEMLRAGAAGQSVLLLRGDLAREAIPAALRSRGATCDDIPVYCTVKPARLPEDFLAAFDAGRIDWITLTSPSSLANLLELLDAPRRGRLSTIRLASIGPVTTRAIRDAGLEVAAEAVPYDVPGLVAAIVAATTKKK